VGPRYEASAVKPLPVILHEGLATLDRVIHPSLGLLCRISKRFS
jgi:hypothetical protein